MTRFAAAIVPDADEVSQLTGEIAAFLDQQGVDARTIHHVSLVIEEILINIGSHGGAGDTPATIRIDVTPDRVDGEIGDQGYPFDPRSAPSADTDAPADARNIGGLGLHLVQRLTSTLKYRRENHRNWTQFCILRGQQMAK